MAERRDFIALEWVAGEIAETLKQAHAALAGYREARDDISRLRFCLAYIHQVSGTLRMVEFAGAGLLAEELEATAQALLAGRVPALARDDAVAALDAGLGFLPDYITRLQQERRDRPVAVLGPVNDLRAVRGEQLITESAVFQPRLDADAGPRTDSGLPAGELAAVLKKLRQMYQAALLGYLRGEQPRDNLNYLAKVCARLEKLAGGQPSALLWRVLIALLEGLLNRSVQPTAAVRALLRQVDSQLKRLCEQGDAGFEQPAPAGLLGNLLYYVAISGASSRYIAAARSAHRLDEALPPESPEALRPRLIDALTGLQRTLPATIAAGTAATQVAVVKQARDLAALLGLARTQQALQTLAGQLNGAVDAAVVERQLGELVAELQALPEDDAERPLFNDSEEAQEQLDKAYDAVLGECRNHLEQAKDAVIEYVANQWQQSYLEGLPELIAGVRGSLVLADMPRAAAVLTACEQYLRNDLLTRAEPPAWQQLDTLADAIASVDYYLERRSEDADADCESVLDVAAQSVAQLGYPLDDVAAAAVWSADAGAPMAAQPYDELADTFAAEPVAETESAAVADAPAPEPVAEEAAAEEEEEVEPVDPEIAEIFIEEAGEVLATIDEFFPQWCANYADTDSLIEVRRAFHTLKGSGRMVGAVDIGELAWSIENMLNRVLDGSVPADPLRAETVRAALALVPAMVSAFEQRRTPDRVAAQQVAERAFALAREAVPAVLPALPGSELLASAPAFESEPEPLEAVAASAEDDVSEEIVEPDEAAWSPDTDEPAPLLADADAGADEPDAVLLEIFAGEAATHLEALEQFLDYARQLAGPAELDENLQRALHTLKGSAHMADVAPVALLVTPVERLVKELRSARIKSDPEVLAALTQADTLLRRALTQLADGRVEPLPETDDFVRDIDALRQVRMALVEGGEEQAEETISPALLDSFLADAIELISAVSDDLQLWRDGHLDEARRRTLAATVAQIADSGEAIGLGTVAELAQPLQALLRRGADFDAPPADYLQLGASAADQLIDMLDRIAGGQQPQLDAALVSALQDYQLPESQLPDYQPSSDQLSPEPATGDDLAEAPLAFAEPPLLTDSVDETAAEAWTEAAASPVADAEPHWNGDADDAELAQPVVDGEIDSETEIVIDEVAEIVEVAAVDLIEPPLLTETIDDEAVAAEPPLLTDVEMALLEDDTQTASEEQSEAVELLGEYLSAPVAGVADETDDADLTESLPVAEALDEAAEALAASTDDAIRIDIDAEAVTEVISDDLSGDENGTVAGAEPEPPLLSDAAALLDSDAIEGELIIDLDTAFEAAPTFSAAEPPSRSVEAPRAPVADFDERPQAPAFASLDDGADDIDSEILEIFLEEAVDLLEGIDSAIHQWGEARDDSRYLDDLQRLLHTLKGGARLAGLKNLGNLSHNFETLLINAQQQGREVDDPFLAEVQSYQDQLIHLVDAVRAGGHAAERLIEAEPETTATGEMSEPVADYIAGLATPERDDATPAAPHDGGVRENGYEDATRKIVPFARPAASAEVVPFTVPTRALVSADDTLPDNTDGGMNVQLRRGPQEAVKIAANVLEQLVNLAGETSIARSRAQEQVSEFGFALDEMQITVDRLHEQVRRLDLETEAQILFRQEQVESVGLEGFDPLEFDRYSLLQQLSRSLLESASDLIDIKSTLGDKTRDLETLLVQQSRINTELQEGLMRSRMVPFARMVPRLRRIIRQVGGELGREIDFRVDNAEGEMDRTVLERIVAPLEHMLRNAVDHGIESVDERIGAGKPARGLIVLALAREGGDVVLTLTDDGRGIDIDAVRAKAIDRGLMSPSTALSDHEVLQFILEAGFSTAKQVTQISGRGVGMDVVHSEIKQLGGSLDIASEWGRGTRFTIRLPFTVSVNRALMVNVAGDIYAIPLNTIEGIVRVSPFELEAYYQPEAPLFEYAGQPYLMRYMGALMRTGDKPNLEGQAMPLPVLLVRGSDHSVAVQVDGLMGSREIVVKSLGPQFAQVQGLSGATVLGDGSVVVILDLMAMIRADALHQHRDLIGHRDDLLPDRSRPLLVMVVDDSVTVRKVTSRFLERQGMEVMLAKDGVDAIHLLTESERVPDVMLLDIEMPRMDGFEVASRVRHTSRLQQMPIIMITSRTGEKHRERAFSLGVNRYLGKPYQEVTLLDTIYELTGAQAPV